MPNFSRPSSHFRKQHGNLFSVSTFTEFEVFWRNDTHFIFLNDFQTPIPQPDCSICLLSCHKTSQTVDTQHTPCAIWLDAILQATAIAVGERVGQLLCYAHRNSSISLSSLCSVIRPLCFTPSQNSFARIFLWVSRGIRSSRSQMRRLASVGPVPWLMRWSSSVSCMWSRSCCTKSECFKFMSAQNQPTNRWLVIVT